MKRLILAILMLALLASSAFAWGLVVDKANPENWYYPGHYKGEFGEATDWGIDGHSAVDYDYRTSYRSSYYNRYSGYGRYSRFGGGNSYNYYNIYSERFNDRFLGFDRWGRRVYAGYY